MNVDLFAGLAVSDLQRAVSWFDRFLGDVESFEPNDIERVWTVAEHRHLYVELQPEHAGHAMVTLFVEDFDGFVAAAAERGIEPEKRETYENGVRKALYRDPLRRQQGRAPFEVGTTIESKLLAPELAASAAASAALHYFLAQPRSWVPDIVPDVEPDVQVVPSRPSNRWSKLLSRWSG